MVPAPMGLFPAAVFKAAVPRKGCLPQNGVLPPEDGALGTADLWGRVDAINTENGRQTDVSQQSSAQQQGPELMQQGHVTSPLTSPSEQDFILLLCVFRFNGNVYRAVPYVALFVTSWFLLTLQKWIMDLAMKWIIDLAMNLCTFISAASKFAQLQCLWKTQDSGAVSALTWGLASYTSAILIRFVVTLALNLWVTATVLRYRKTGVKAE
ncbi:PQ-loop repeat-containing protein 3 [Myotis brandtii]|uniref:PQ-loop repeat-containing protein 3 n=1 Tax=Myotis brandtii TaxID=109478 RepID=S7MY11_MYOBR|nr:PQ-loop repeat-containing protein 3 [Myotis brandtii]